MKVSTFRCPDELYSEVEMVCSILGVSVSDFMRESIKDQIEKKRKDPIFKKRLKENIEKHKKLLDRLSKG